MRKESIQEMVKYIEENLNHEITLANIANRVNYSPYYCSASFRRYSGTSIKSYILRRRLQRASEELKNSEMRILDIAYKYCYSSQEAFSRGFQNFFGITPFEYRKKQLPIAMYESKDKGDEYMNKDHVIRDIQMEIKERYPENVLHILSGGCMLEDFKKNNRMQENHTYMPFNEAMCWGEGDREIFSDEFVKKRAQSLNVGEDMYREISIKAAEPLINGEFDTVVLWFGDDMFCQINMLTVLGYLEQRGFDGDVLFCMALESRDEMLPDAHEIKLDGSLERYREVVCRKRMPHEKLMPVMYQGIKLYLNYTSENGEIKRFIKGNGDKEAEKLVWELIKTFPQYGLGDTQYFELIEEVRNKESSNK